MIEISTIIFGVLFVISEGLGLRKKQGNGIIDLIKCSYNSDCRAGSVNIHIDNTQQNE